MSFLDYFLRSTILIAFAAVLALMLRRSSAARRHVIWASALVALLALPLLRNWTPRWTVPAPALETLPPGPVRTVVEVTARRSSGIDLSTALTALWIAGACVVLFRYGRAQWAAARLLSASHPIAGHPDDVRISGGIQVPMVYGFARPVVLLPAAANEWPEEQLRSVIAHERMHIERKDLWWQAAAHLACAIYWPQPLVWLAAAAMRKECELACDDGVLVGGTPASAYAGHLVSIARALSVRETADFGGIAMTRTSQLTSRVSAVLDPQANRVAAGARFALSSAGCALAALLTLAAVELPAFAQGGMLNGVVRDASGATVPRARVDIKTADGKYHEITYTNAIGEYMLKEVPDGAYELSVAKPGFARMTVSGMAFDRTSTKPIDVTLQVGAIRETMEVQGQRDAAPAAATTPSGPPTRIRVGGNVQAAKLVQRTRPLYPQTAKADGVQGTVLLKAVIGLDGSIASLEPVNKQVDKRLVDHAIDAVKQWRYQPTLLNGQPVEVMTEIEINYTLAP